MNGHRGHATNHSLRKWVNRGRGAEIRAQEAKKIGSTCEKTQFCQAMTLLAELTEKLQAPSS